MKRNPLITFHGLAAAALLLGAAGLATAQTTNFYVNAFTANGNTADQTPSGCGVWYGGSLMLFDPSTADPLASPGDDSCYIYVNLSENDSGQVNAMEDFIVPGPYDNLWYNGNPSGVQLSLYKAVHFDVLWDTVNSTVGIDQFNNVTSINPGLSSSDPNTNGVGLGLDVQVAGLGTTSPEPVTLGYVNIPDAASNGWVSITIPINPNASGIDGGVGILFKKWLSTAADVPANSTAYFWVGNVWFEGSAAPPPPPTLQLPVKPTPGLNVFASTPGVYDRQQACLVASNGISWVGHATAANPVTYSFTIDGFPQDPATEYGCEAYLMMAPNPAAYDGALDWNETNCIVFWLEQGAGSTVMNFSYKTNSPGAASNIAVGTVTNNGTALGTWSVTFTSDTNCTMTAPDGNTSSFLFTNASYFAETKNPGCYLYLGMQPNNSAGLNDAVTYSQFSLTGVPAAVTDNFTADTTLNTNLWYNFMATGPLGVFVNPTNAALWLKWNTPAAGFHLRESSNLQGPWVEPTDDLILNGAGAYLQLITTNDIPAGTPNAFFQLSNP
jgi:hypothetical protein